MPQDAPPMPPERAHDVACWALHDLGGPLRAFDAVLDLLAEKDADTEALLIGARATGRMGATIAGLTRFADAHVAPLSLAPVDLRGAVRAAWAEAEAGWTEAPADDAPDGADGSDHWRRPLEGRRHAARGRPQAELELSPALAALPPCRADAAALNTILVELFGNAARYGRAPHEVARVHVDGAARDGTVRLLVRDHGPGIPRHLAGDAFEPMRRLHAQSEVEGAGLGLSVARLLAVRQGGALHFQAAPTGACAVLQLVEDKLDP